MTTESPSGFHYFVHNGMNRCERIQALVINEILNSKLSQDKRESSAIWELKHSSAVMQFAKILARKRNVDEELAIIAAGLHDIQVIINGKYENHARLGGALAEKILRQTNEFTENEIEKIVHAVSSHSDKHIYSENKLVELVNLTF